MYDDLVANEEEWLEFLDHPKNSLLAYECLRVSYEYALIQYKKHEHNQDRDTHTFLFEIADVMKKLINVQKKHIGSVSSKGRELFEEIEFLAEYFIWNGGLWKELHEYSRLFKKLLAYEVRKGWRPLVMQEWQTTRAQLKARGIDAPSNINDVDDKVIYENLMFNAKENDSWKRGDYGSTELKKDLIKFFEMNDNIVSRQKRERINKFVDELSGPRARIVYSFFGTAPKDELQLFRTRINTVGDLDKAIDWISKQGDY